MGERDDHPLLDMVVKRISEEVAQVLKVDPTNVEQHLGETQKLIPDEFLHTMAHTGTCLADEVQRLGDRNQAVASQAGLEPEAGDLDARLRAALVRLEDRKANRMAERETAPVRDRETGPIRYVPHKASTERPQR